MAWNPSFNFKLRDDEVTLGPLILDKTCAEMIANLLLDIKAGMHVDINTLDMIVKAGCFTDEEFTQIHTELIAIKEDLKTFRGLSRWGDSVCNFMNQCQSIAKYVVGSNTWFEQYIAMKELAAEMYSELLAVRAPIPIEKQGEWAQRYGEVLEHSTSKERNEKLIENQFKQNVSNGMDLREAARIKCETSIELGVWDEKMAEKINDYDFMADALIAKPESKKTAVAPTAHDDIRDYLTECKERVLNNPVYLRSATSAIVDFVKEINIEAWRYIIEESYEEHKEDSPMNQYEAFCKIVNEMLNDATVKQRIDEINPTFVKPTIYEKEDKIILTAGVVADTITKLLTIKDTATRDTQLFALQGILQRDCYDGIQTVADLTLLWDVIKSTTGSTNLENWKKFADALTFNLNATTFDYNECKCLKSQWDKLCEQVAVEESAIEKGEEESNRIRVTVDWLSKTYSEIAGMYKDVRACDEAIHRLWDGTVKDFFRTFSSNQEVTDVYTKAAKYANKSLNDYVAAWSILLNGLQAPDCVKAIEDAKLYVPQEVIDCVKSPMFKVTSDVILAEYKKSQSLTAEAKISYLDGLWCVLQSRCANSIIATEELREICNKIENATTGYQTITAFDELTVALSNPINKAEFDRVADYCYEDYWNRMWN